MAKSVAQIAASANRAGKVIVGANKTATTKAALAYKTSTLTQARKNSGGDLRLSRWGKKGVKLGVGFEVEGTLQTTATVTPRPMGPWKVLEYGAKPHLIVPGLTRRQARAMSMFSAMAGGRGSFDVAELAATARGNRNNRGGRRRKKVKPLLINGKPYSWARHPGVKQPAKTWSKGIAAGTDDALKAYRESQVASIRKAFK